MPRNENPLDPLAGPVAAFASDLRTLRHEAGHMTYRVMAKRTGYSVTTLSVAASGASLPSLEVTLAYVQACGGDAQQWRARWCKTAEHRQQPQGGAPVSGLNSSGLRSSSLRGGLAAGAVVKEAKPVPAARTVAVSAGTAVASQPSRKRRRPGFWAIGAAVEAGLLVVALVGLTYGRTAQASPPAASVGGEHGSPLTAVPTQENCTMPTWQPVLGSVPDRSLDDVQHLSTWVAWPSPSGVPIILRRSAPPTSNSPVLSQLSGDIEDGFTARYTDGTPTDGDVPDITLNVATPKPGTCMTQLVDYAEVGLSDGRQDTSPSNVSFVTPGPLLKAAHAVLMCSNYNVPVGIPTTCAWAGPVDGTGTPFFGQYWIHPESSGPPQQYLGVATADYADQMFAELNAKPPRSAVLSQ